jgi:hypothetical protein
VSPKPVLRVVGQPEPAVPQVLFCSHCGEAPPTPMAARSRVCALCGLGVIIGAAEDVAPRPGESFLIVDRMLKLCALSKGAERLLGVEEPVAVHRHVSEFLEPADAETQERDALVAGIVAVAGGAAGASGSGLMVVRPAGEYGVRYAARIAGCGPPQGALIVLADHFV